MGNFEKLSVLVIVVIIVMILVVALYTWTDKPSDSATSGTSNSNAGTALDRSSSPDPYEADPIPDGGKKIDVDPDPVTDPDPKIGDPVIVKVDPDPEDYDPGVLPPADPPADPEPVSNEPWQYVVKKGDVFSVVCNRELGAYYKYLPELKALNPGTDFNSISIGQTITMPPKGSKSDSATASGTSPTTPVIASGAVKPGGEYVVRGRETLKDIAKEVYGDWTMWMRIYAKNHTSISNPDYLQPGTKLKLPTR